MDVTFKNNKAVTYVVSREGVKLFKDMFESDKSASDQEKEDPTQRGQEVWERIR